MATERVVLVGAGDHGRGVLEILRAMERAGTPVECIGFADDHPPEGEVDGVPCLGTVSWLEESLSGIDASVILALASPQAKRALAGRLEAVGARFGRALHPRAEVAPSVRLEPGCVVNAGAAIVYETRVGAHVTVNLNATVGHHVDLGDFSTVAPGANILGKVQVGEGCMINANAVILPSLSVGEGAVVGAGAVVLQDVPASTTVFGNPARPVPVFR